MRFVFRKPDLDTVTAAVVLGYHADLQLDHVPCNASLEDLTNPEVICLECGGSGQWDRGNFDHHDTELALPPACIQALSISGIKAPTLQHLVDYVAAIDTGTRLSPPPKVRLTLSSLLSGMRLVVQDPLDQFRCGAALISELVSLKASPWDVPRQLADPSWVAAKRLARRRTTSMSCTIERFTTDQGRLAMLLRVGAPGAHGLMRSLGAEISVASGLNHRGHYSIAGPKPAMQILSAKLNDIEKGWGGPGQGEIIGSPLQGSLLDDRTIRSYVCHFG